jgi:UDP-glucose 4-epimerase
MTHLAAEEMVKLFRDKGMGTLIFRLSNSYGYPMDKNVNRWTLVVNDLCRQLVNFGRISLKTSGKQHRDFISLHDVSRAVHHFIFSVPDAWNNDVYNLGGECTMSILNMAETIARIYAQESGKEPGGISLAEGNNGDIGDIKYNIDKLKNTGFHLEGNMSYEIKKTLKLCEEMKRKSELEKDTNNVKAG